MARQQVHNLAPFINTDFYVTSIFGDYRTSGTHTGIDIATSIPASIYSISKGVVHYKGYDSNGFGHYVIIKNTDDNKGFLYAHMASASVLAIGQAVNIGTYIGLEGRSGYATGVHLHLEYQIMKNGEWTYSDNLSDYLNPAEYMGINNVEDYNNSWFYSGIPYQPTPTKNKHRRKFKFVLYAQKIRKHTNF